MAWSSAYLTPTAMGLRSAGSTTRIISAATHGTSALKTSRLLKILSTWQTISAWLAKSVRGGAIIRITRSTSVRKLANLNRKLSKTRIHWQRASAKEVSTTTPTITRSVRRNGSGYAMLIKCSLGTAQENSCRPWPPIISLAAKVSRILSTQACQMCTLTRTTWQRCTALVPPWSHLVSTSSILWLPTGAPIIRAWLK